MTDTNESSKKRILIVEDDPEIADLLTLHLDGQNYLTKHCADGQDGFDLALQEPFDLIVLDLMLPRLDGFEICRRLRGEQRYIPILMLTSRVDEIDRVLGLEIGADDYLTKPFSIRELIARVKAIFRRVESLATQPAETSNGKVLRFGELQIDTVRRKISITGNTVELTVKEFDLLTLLASNPGRAYSREKLLDMVWGYQFEGYEHTVNSHINRLRSKIEKDPANPEYVKTVWGYGYRFIEPEELES